MRSARAAELDGRQSRTARSRLAICDACLDLVQEGVLQPSADQIAERAGVSIGSLYQYFGSKDDILRVLLEKHRQVKVEKYRDPREGATSFIPSVRVDVTLADPSAMCLLFNIPTTLT